MCGIAGIASIGSSPDLSVRISRMVHSIKHRGPDSLGTLLHGRVAFGHARLAIVDLSDAANQPMLSDSGRHSIIFNGEIYNFKDLRKDLEKAGFRFKTHSDTEVLLKGYEHWGDKFIERLNGIFAIALHDRVQDRILLARDRLGVKPLYWKKSNSEFLFGSEIKAIVAASDERQSLNYDGLLEYLSFQNHYGQATLFSGVNLFPAGSIGVVNCENLEFNTRRFWSASVLPNYKTRESAHDSIEEALSAAVHRQMVADVPVNSFLSGGIDSCAIASLAAKSAGRIKTFTCGFGLNGVTAAERQFDERALAELVSSNIGSEHYEAVLNADDFIERMQHWAWHAEEPRVGSSFPNFCVAGLASRFTKVCMSGTGGDELFGGYPWRYQAAMHTNHRDEFARQYYQFWHRMVPSKDFQALTAPISHSNQYDSFEVFNSRLREVELRAERSDFSLPNAALLFEMETFLQGLLIVEDKASMAHGLEVRVPLLDNDVIDAALATPFSFKVEQSVKQIFEQYGRGASTMPSFASGKIILREVLSRHVPPEIIAGRKQGFSPPFETWFRTGMRSWVESDVFGPNSRLAGLIDLRIARRLWGEHINGVANHRLFVWGMISLHLCIETFNLST